MWSRLRLASGVCAAFALVAAIGLAAREPIAFQKIASITDTRLPRFEPGSAIDIVPMVRAIPDRGAEGSKDTVFEVHPARRYQRAVVEGFGNCSNLVKGLSWALVRDGYDFEIVHLLPIHAFLSGEGHTVLRAKLALPEGERTGIVDVAAAAIPRSGGRMLDVADLVGGRPDAHLDPLRYESEPWQQFYKSAFLEDAVVGRISGPEQARWYRLLDAVYVDLGLPTKVDKIIYLGIGVVLGVYPLIHVDDLATLRSAHPRDFAVMRAALWVFRLAPLVLVGCVVSWLVERGLARFGREPRRQVPIGLERPAQESALRR